MVSYRTEIKSYADDRGIAIDSVNLLEFNVSFALFCKECHRCVIITIYPDIDESPNSYKSDDNLRHMHIVICKDCVMNISSGKQWTINPKLLSDSKVYRLVAKFARTKLFDANGDPILRICSALRSDSVYNHIMRIKGNLYLDAYTIREVSDSQTPLIMSSDGNGFF